MKRNITALLCGILFGVGLALAGMTDTQKILGFLDIFGNWQYELALVMASGLLVAGIGFRVFLKRPAPILEGSFQIPARRDIDQPLVLGAVLFGAGWGLYGYCPGPAITALAYGQLEPLVFVLAMVGGMLLRHWQTDKR